MGVIPLEFLPGDTAQSLGLTGRERYTITIPDKLSPRMAVDVKVSGGARRPLTPLLPSVTVGCVSSAAGQREAFPGEDEVRHRRGAGLLPPRRHPQLHDPQNGSKVTRQVADGVKCIFLCHANEFFFFFFQFERVMSCPD